MVRWYPDTIYRRSQWCQRSPERLCHYRSGTSGRRASDRAGNGTTCQQRYLRCVSGRILCLPSHQRCFSVRELCFNERGANHPRFCRGSGYGLSSVLDGVQWAGVATGWRSAQPYGRHDRISRHIGRWPTSGWPHGLATDPQPVATHLSAMKRPPNWGPCFSRPPITY